MTYIFDVCIKANKRQSSPNIFPHLIPNYFDNCLTLVWCCTLEIGHISYHSVIYLSCATKIRINTKRTYCN